MTLVFSNHKVYFTILVKLWLKLFPPSKKNKLCFSYHSVHSDAGIISEGKFHRLCLYQNGAQVTNNKAHLNCGACQSSCMFSQLNRQHYNEMMNLKRLMKLMTYQVGFHNTVSYRQYAPHQAQ